MTNEKTYEYFLHDVGSHIKERALKSKAERAKTEPGSREFEFETGRMWGLGEAISLLQQTLEAFGIPVEAMQLQDIEFERDLI